MTGTLLLWGWVGGIFNNLLPENLSQNVTEQRETEKARVCECLVSLTSWPHLDNDESLKDLCVAYGDGHVIIVKAPNYLSPRNNRQDQIVQGVPIELLDLQN